ncbi:MAG: GAF domain-containing protein, partial [Bacteroidia bacterium]|nr:GAF domain-containing protein [Bacteroidia bacterium]
METIVASSASSTSNSIDSKLARFSELLRNRSIHQTVEEWSFIILENLIESVNGLQAVFYLTTEELPQRLILSGSYGVERSSVQQELAWGEGLIGQAAKSKRRFILSQNGFMEIKATTGLGKLKPRMLVVQPLLSEERVEGVLEISSLYQFDLEQKEFLEKLATLIASNLSSIRSQEKMRQLYLHAQEQERIVKETNANLDLLVAKRTKELEKALFELEAT